MEAVERLGVTIALRIDESRGLVHGEPRPWTVVLSGPLFGGSGVIRTDCADLVDCLDFVEQRVGDRGKIETPHPDAAGAPADVDADGFEELLTELAAHGVGFLIQRNHLPVSHFTTPWRVIVSGEALVKGVAMDESGTFRQCVDRALRWLRPRLEDGEWLDLYL